jgi:hypothetical protein
MIRQELTREKLEAQEVMKATDNEQHKKRQSVIEIGC